MVALSVEGGGDGGALRAELRNGLQAFLERAGFRGKMPKIYLKGGRQNAFNSYRDALAAGQDAMLLVDSEAPVQPSHQSGAYEDWRPWLHLNQHHGNGWVRPQGAADSDCHLMAQFMESWLLADREALQDFFGQGFRSAALPPVARPVEDIPKADAQRALAAASRASKTKGEYNKGDHSFELLAKLDPAKVAAKCPWAARLLKLLGQRLAG